MIQVWNRSDFFTHRNTQTEGKIYRPARKVFFVNEYLENDSQWQSFLRHICLTILFITAHGSWSTWSSYSVCSASCNGGNQTRSRSCTSPAPVKGGDLCLNLKGDRTMAEVQGRPCNLKTCPRKQTRRFSLVRISLLIWISGKWKIIFHFSWWWMVLLE